MERPRRFEMLQTLKNAWRVPELRNKLLFTLLIILIYRLGASIPVPFVDSQLLNYYSQYSGTVLDFMSILSGGAMAQATLFALSVSPYITASIVMQLLTIAIPPLERMAKEEDGKKKINVITRYVTIALALVTSFGYTMLLKNNGWLVEGVGAFEIIVMIACYCAGASLIMWLAEKINEFGIGNGISVILFANIIASVPNMAMTVWYWIFPTFSFSTWDFTSFNVGGLIAALVVLIAVLGLTVLSVWFTNSERKIPVQYAKRVVGRKMYGGQGTHLPLKMNMAGVMPIIFASSIVSLVPTILAFCGVSEKNPWSRFFAADGVFYPIALFVLIIAFSYFYTQITFDPVEVSNRIKSQGGTIAGIRQGKPTSDFIKSVLNKVTLVGALFLGFIAVLPVVAGPHAIQHLLTWFNTGINYGIWQVNVSTLTSTFTFGGTTLLILVGVVLETFREIEAQLTMRNYKGFL